MIKNQNNTIDKNISKNYCSRNGGLRSSIFKGGSFDATSINNKQNSIFN